jgi:hypothetical protein
VYLDDAAADAWNYSLVGGLKRFMAQAKAHSIQPLIPDDSTWKHELHFGMESPIKVFIVMRHAGWNVEWISRHISSTKTVKVYVFSTTPFRLRFGTDPLGVQTSPASARDQVLFTLRRALQEAASKFQVPMDLIREDDSVICEYLPMTWVTLLPNVLLLNSSQMVPHLGSPSAQLVPLQRLSNGMEVDQAKALAVALFGIMQFRECNPFIWTLGEQATRIAQELFKIRSQLQVSKSMENSNAAIIIVDRVGF